MVLGVMVRRGRGTRVMVRRGRGTRVMVRRGPGSWGHGEKGAWY